MDAEELSKPVHTPLGRSIRLPIARVFLGIFMFLFGPLKVRGKEKVPRQGGLLILANHLSDCDPVATQIAAPRPVHFMAKSELFEIPVLRNVLVWFGSFPVKRGEPDRTAIKRAVALAKAGEAVVIYPEGQISEDAKLQELKAGVALIVRMAGVPVTCLGLQNTQRVIPYGKVLPRPAFRTIWAKWGEARTFEKGASPEEILGWVESELRTLTGQPAVPPAAERL